MISHGKKSQRSSSSFTLSCRCNSTTISVIFSVIFLSSLSYADIFSSSTHISNLMHLERHLVTSMIEYIKHTEDRLATVKHYLNDFASAAGQSTGSYAPDLMSNPLQAYKLIRRLAVGFSKIESEMRANTGQWSRVENLLEEYRDFMPSKDDLNSAALALIRLQDTYRLNATDMSQGQLVIAGQRIVYSTSNNPDLTMTARDCLYIGKSAFNAGYYGLALDWFDNALHHAYYEGNSTASVQEILPFQTMAIEAHHKVENELRKHDFPIENEKIRVLDYDSDDFRAYQQLCRGESLVNISTKWNEKKCFYSAQHPVLKLNPIKVEQHSKQPFVVVFHNIMNKEEIEQLKSLAKPTLTRARVQTDDQPEEVSRVRVSSTAWFSESSHPLVKHLNNRISYLTGLSTNMNNGHCELVQVANYGIGGHYVPHYDYLFKDRPESKRLDINEREKRAGDRIATFMIYLSDVPQGGSTVFTRLNIHVSPTPGSALFWFNLYRNGEGIMDTVHGACPVLIGEKWVANYWIREHGQTFRRPCSLNAEE